jgi:hypothetical protein
LGLRPREKYGIKPNALPTIVLFVNGKAVKAWEGFAPENAPDEVCTNLVEQVFFNSLSFLENPDETSDEPLIEGRHNSLDGRQGLAFHEVRMRACLSCPQRVKLIPVTVCGKCGCLMGLKTRFQSSSCPDGHW